jgi:hypothetical protein
MRHVLLPSLILLTLALSCGEKPNGGGKTPDGKESAVWSLPAPLVQKVEVSTDGTVIESYEYTYDDQARLLSLKKTDRLSNAVLLDLQYTYPDGAGMKATGKFFPITTNRYVSAVKDLSQKTVSYAGSWTGAGAYVTAFDAGGTATGTTLDAEFAAPKGQYSSRTQYGETYTVSGGCISRSVIGTAVRSQTSQSTSAAAETALTVDYSYSDREDRQNFAVYLFPCEFPVWVAAGLPGCKKLVREIKMASGSVPSPVSTRIDYSFRTDGNIDTAVRTDLNNGETVLVRTYKFFYQ